MIEFSKNELDRSYEDVCKQESCRVYGTATSKVVINLN